MILLRRVQVQEILRAKILKTNLQITFLGLINTPSDSFRNIRSYQRVNAHYYF